MRIVALVIAATACAAGCAVTWHDPETAADLAPTCAVGKDLVGTYDLGEPVLEAHAACVDLAKAVGDTIFPKVFSLSGDSVRYHMSSVEPPGRSAEFFFDEDCDLALGHLHGSYMEGLETFAGRTVHVRSFEATITPLGDAVELGLTMLVDSEPAGDPGFPCTIAGRVRATQR